MTDKNFVHLHLHTEYSLLDGFARIKDAVAYAKELNMPALAITDHGTMFGVIDFFRACQKAGIKPIIGVEAYLAQRGMTDRDSQKDSKPYHMLLLAENQEGYQNLLKISSAAQLDGFYYRPRIDKEFLAQHAKGVIATSGCLAAEIPRMVEWGREDEAHELIGWYQDVFGKDNFFLELQEHGIPELETLNRWLLENSRYAGVPLVATNDVHYVRPTDHEIHDTLLCIQTNSLKHETNRMKMDPAYHMRTQQEMWEIFGKATPESLTNTLELAERCNVELESGNYHLPIFPVPPQFDDPGDYLRYLCEKGLQWRYGERATEAEIANRLNHELNVIHKMGFDTYFLIVWDLCEYARHADIWWNVRGSGAGSVVAYCLGITNLDPLENALIFERFLNPGRVSMPDFDLDYPEDRRTEMIEYCTRKYGEDKVAAIITFGTLGAKGGIRDVGRAFDVPLSEVDKIARTIPTAPKLPPLMELVGNDPDKAIPELREFYINNPEARRIIEAAANLEGTPRHASTHAAGIIVADKPLVEYIPLHRPTKGDAEDNPVKMVTQFPMETAESIGLLKIDFLGLSTLTVLRRACELIERYHGVSYDMSSIPIKTSPQNPEITRRVEQTFDMIGQGNTIGVFQIESSGMRQMLTEMKPRTFEHIIAAISLYRPGPMDYIPTYNARMHGREPVHYHHPRLKPILDNTYGIIVYQEQILQIGAQLFGYTLGEADLMRRAVSKKKEKELKKHRETFLERGPENGVDEKASNAIFDDIEFFARYGFNKCVVGSTTIIDAQTGRRVQINDLISGKENIEETLSLDTDTLQLKPARIMAIMDNGVKPVYRLTTCTGRQIEATANHPFYTFDGWRMLGELSPGDNIAIPRRISIQNQFDDGQLEWLDEEAMTLTLQEDHGLAIENDIAWDFIESIEYVGEEPTYDLTIEGTHNFIANDIIVHNSHAADYAVITCQTAFLKCHYPHEYMAALMSVYYDASAKVSLFISDCRRMGIQVLPPDINYAFADFSIEAHQDGSKHIRFGMGAIKNLGLGSIEYIIEEREENGLFRDMDDFLQRCDMRTVGKRGLESLIKVGAFDSLAPHYRAHMMANLDRIMSFSTEYHKNAASGQVSMFELMGSQDGSGTSVFSSMTADPPPSWNRREILRWEKELVGVYLSEHPLSVIWHTLEYTINCTTAELIEGGESMAGRQVRMAGLVNDLRKITTKKGEPMAIMNLEDLQGNVEVVIFPKTWTKCKDIVDIDRVVIIRGKTDMRGGDIQVIADHIEQNFTRAAPADNLPISPPKPLPINPPLAALPDDELDNEPDEDNTESFTDSRPLDEFPETTRHTALSREIFEDESDSFEDFDESGEEPPNMGPLNLPDVPPGNYDDEDNFYVPDRPVHEDRSSAGITHTHHQESNRLFSLPATYENPRRENGNGHQQPEKSTSLPAHKDLGPLFQYDFSGGNNGNGQGHSGSNGKNGKNGKGDTMYNLMDDDADNDYFPTVSSGSESRPEKSVTLPRLLVVQMRRSKDLQISQNRLHIVYNEAYEYPGSDRLQVHLVETTGAMIHGLDFPELSIGICQDLMDKLLKYDWIQDIYITEL